MTDQERAAKISALIEERSGYATRGLDDRVSEVDAQLKILGAEGKPPAKRATTRKTTTKKG